MVGSTLVMCRVTSSKQQLFSLILLFIHPSDSDHPLTHLMKSVFRLHNPRCFRVFLYATSPPDGSLFRQYYERQTEFQFQDVSSWSTTSIVDKIVQDQIHIRSCFFIGFVSQLTQRSR